MPLITRKQKEEAHKDFISEFRLFRRRRGWSGTKAALELGISRQHYSDIESGKQKPSQELIKEMIYLKKVLEK